MTTPINALTQRAYTGKSNIANLLSTWYSKQERLTETQAKMIGSDIKPQAKACEIKRINKVVELDWEWNLLPKIKVLTHIVYNIDDITKPIMDIKQAYQLQRQKFTKKFGKSTWEWRYSKTLLSQKQYDYLTHLIKKEYCDSEDMQQQLLEKAKKLSPKEATLAIQKLLPTKTPH
jgi:hypothetical protein